MIFDWIMQTACPIISFIIFIIIIIFDEEGNFVSPSILKRVHYLTRSRRKLLRSCKLHTVRYSLR